MRQAQSRDSTPFDTGSLDVKPAEQPTKKSIATGVPLYSLDEDAESFYMRYRLGPLYVTMTALGTGVNPSTKLRFSECETAKV